jgi:phosphatidylglycerophosphate synthase
MREAYDKINYFLPKPILDFFLRTNLTPNQITVGRFLFFLIPAVILFTLGNYWLNVLGLVMVYFFSLLDLVDGEVAKRKGMITEIGPWLDTTLDMISLIFVYGGFTIGIYRKDPSFDNLLLGLILLALYGISAILTMDLQRIFNIGPRTSEDFIDKFRRSKKKIIADSVLGHVLLPHGQLSRMIFSTKYFLTLGIVFNLVKPALMMVAFLYFVRWITIYFLIAYVLAIRRDKSGLVIIRLLKERKERVKNGK